MLLLCLPVLAQTSQSEAKHFAKDGLAFDYPGQWVLDDQSNQHMQQLVITRPGSSALIMVIAFRQPVTSFDRLKAASRSITEPYIESVAQKFGAAGTPATREPLCTEVGALENGAGVRLRGALNKEPGTGEIYSLLMGHRFVNLVYIRTDKDDAQGAMAWDTVRQSLKVEESVTGTTTVEPGIESHRPVLTDIGVDLVLNGRALSLPAPQYPAIAKAAHAWGTVTVKVVIDEEGKVISAVPVSGHPLLQAPAHQAALHARFSPTLVCNKQVKVPGIITYNFVLP